jgi:hypothetical protein
MEQLGVFAAEETDYFSCPSTDVGIQDSEHSPVHHGKQPVELDVQIW